MNITENTTDNLSQLNMTEETIDDMCQPTYSFKEKISHIMESAFKAVYFAAIEPIFPIKYNFIAEELFLSAVRNGDIPTVKQYIEMGIPLEFSSKNSALNSAINSRHPNKIEILKIIIENGADLSFPCIRYNGGETPLHTALNVAIERKGYGDTYYPEQLDIDILKMLIEAGANIHDFNTHLFADRVLHVAVKFGNLEIVQLLLDKGADINARGEYLSGSTMPLVHAAYNGDAVMVKFLLDNGANTQTYFPYSKMRNNNADNSSALFNAIKSGDIPTIELLLEHGIDKNLELTPLHIATITNKLDDINLLLDSQTDVNALDALGFTPCFYASTMGHSKALKTLIEHGLDKGVDVQYCIEGQSLLHASVNQNNIETMKMLFEKGADANQWVKVDGGTATLLYMAVSTERSLDTIKVLLEQGAEVNVYGKQTILNEATQNAAFKALTGQDTEYAYEVLKLLIAHGADPYLVNREDESAFDMLKQIKDKPGFQEIESILMPVEEKKLSLDSVLEFNNSSDIFGLEHGSDHPFPPINSTTSILPTLDHFDNATF